MDDGCRCQAGVEGVAGAFEQAGRMKAIPYESLNDAMKAQVEKQIVKENSNRTTVPTTNMESNTRNEPLATGKNAHLAAPVSIHIHSIRKRSVDSDGISGKYAIDQLVNSRLLIDDSPAYVKEVTYSQEKGAPEKTTITLTEVKQ